MKNNNGLPVANGRLGDARSKTTTIHDYLAILYRGRWTIIIAFVLTMSLAAYETFTTPPVYEASTTIMIDQRGAVGQSLFPESRLQGQMTLINNQVEILKSRSLAKAVLERLWRSPYRDSLAILKEIETGATTQEAIRSIQSSIAVSPISNTELIEIRVQAGTPFEASYLTKSVARAYQDMDQSLSRGEISQVVDFLVEQLDRKEKKLKTSEDALKAFLEQEKIASLSDEATQVVQQGADFESMYRGVLIDLEVTKKRLNYLKSRLGTSKKTLESEISRVSSPLVLKLRQEMAQIERNISVYLSQGVGEQDPQVRREREKLKAIKSRLTEETRKLIVDGLPADDPLAQAQELVVKILQAETDIAALTARAEGLKRVVDSYSQKLEGLPDKNVQLARLERNRKVDEKLYMMMREKFEESRITQAGEIGKVRILDDPFLPEKPISPKKKLNMILGCFLGLGIGLGITFLRDFLDTSVRRVEDLEALGLNVLAAIPEIDNSMLSGILDKRNGTTNGKANGKVNGTTNGVANGKLNGGANGMLPNEQMRLVTHFKPKSPVSEAYRSLRTNLQFSNADKKLHCLLVTSSGPAEGKSTTAANLAIAISMQGARTILVDTDLRRPVIHRIFGLEKNRGLTNVLVGKMGLDDAIQPSNIQNLDILTSGILPPNPAELLGSERMKEFIATIKGRYEMVIFDSPPLIAVTDAAVLAKELDGVLLVVKSGQTNQDALTRAVELLGNVNARLLGALLNGVSRENTYGSYYYYYYYHYYYYYGESGDKKRKKAGKRSRHHSKASPLA